MGMNSGASVRALFLLLLNYWFELCNSSKDTITSTDFIKDSETIVSNGSLFKLGFFSPGDSDKRYVGIWYGNISLTSVVWVANREKPLNDTSGILRMSEDGNLQVLNGEEVIWSSSVPNDVSNTTAQLLDSGNLVLKDDSSGRIIWESFHHPSHSYLENMTISTNPKTGEKLAPTSWKNPSDPSIGSFSLGVDPSNIPQILIWNGSDPYYRTGPWNNLIFIGVPDMNTYIRSGFRVVQDADGTVSVSFTTGGPVSFYFILTPKGTIQEITRQKDDWQVTWESKQTECDVYGKCGAFGICNPKNSPICSCLRGYVPKSVEEWNKGNWTGGCVRKTPLQCQKTNSSIEEGRTDRFFRITTVKVPDFVEWLPALSSECRDMCVTNCSCIAYSVYNGIGCMSWSRGLIDVQQFSERGADLYIRVADTELDEKGNVKVIVSVILVSGTFAVICIYFSWRWWMAKQRARARSEEPGGGVSLFERGNVRTEFSGANLLGSSVNQGKLEEQLLVSLEKLMTATNNFHEANKLGQGGFGSVYRVMLLHRSGALLGEIMLGLVFIGLMIVLKGKFPGGQEIAVKRLARASAQGIEEFLNEVMVISNVQHRNLVRLLGCCTEGGEKMLVYEYLPNKSLDAFLCDPAKRVYLTWRRRFSIIEGIARGLQYLHRDSRLRIIHRDLKPSNILLDEDMNPKISDFGMARIFQGKQDKANTMRIAGTYGYMSPEYAFRGIFSEKSDVFSFGVLLLEIISGTKSADFCHDEQSLSLLGHAWKLWREGSMEAFIDGSIAEEPSQGEILRCIHVGLLCVQELAKDRPSISVALSMICSEIGHLPPPKPPAYSESQTPTDTESSRNQNLCSVNQVTITEVQAR